MQRPQHHEDLRDHGARPRVRDLWDARRGGVEARRDLTAPRVTLRAAAVTLAVATSLLTAGCGAVGRSTSGDASSGKALFVKSPGDGKPACSACHTLADAGAKGTIGPNLDDAFETVRTQRNGGFDDSTIRDVVRGQIAYAEEPMPQNLYEGQQADDISAYVAKCAGVRSCGVQATGGGGGGGGTTATPTTQTETSTSGGGRGGAGSKVAEGKKIFTGTAGCSSCHTLKDANATGTIGPNLDEKKPTKALAVERVTNGKSPMPSFKGQLTPAQIDAVATYVSSVAGK